MTSEKGRGSSAALFVLGGAVVGAVAALLFAPKAGSELRTDIEDWGRRNRETARRFASKLKSYIPRRGKEGMDLVKSNGGAEKPTEAAAQ